MKNNTSVILLFFLFTFLSTKKTIAQDIAISFFIEPYAKKYHISNKIVIKNAILKDGKYTYLYKEETITVEINNGFYYEYFGNGEYIKAKLDWTSEYNYILNLVDINRQGFPFKIGTKLKGKIEKVVGNTFFYNTNINNKSYYGSFTTLDDD